VQPWEWDQVHSKLPEVRVELARETETAGNTTHGCRDKVVKITNCKNGKIGKKTKLTNLAIETEQKRSRYAVKYVHIPVNR
jgi:hypothetical protein